MNKIRDLRKSRRMSMKELGAIVGVAESTISLYETGKRQADNDTLLKLADYFNVSVDYLLGREEPPTNAEPLQIPEKYKDVMVAFNGGADNLTQDDIKDVVKYIEFLRNKHTDD